LICSLSHDTATTEIYTLSLHDALPILAAPSESESLNTNLELRFDNGGPFRGTLRWVHGDSERRYTEARADSLVTRGSEITLPDGDRKSTRLNSSHVKISYAVFCLKKKK